jgi:hypothetical protein
MRVARVFALLAVLTFVAAPVRAGTASRSEWRTTSSPPARCCFGMARNPGGGVVMFGGIGDGSELLGDTWTWKGAAWTERHPAHSPRPRDGITLVYDATNRDVVMFGGDFEGGYLGDTWTWDGADWTHHDPAHPPPDQCCYGMGFDAATGLVTYWDPARAQTWTWDGVDWMKQQPPVSPPSRDSAQQVARDGDHIVLFGGAICPELCDYRFRDTWTWDGASWTEQSPGNPPRGRYGAAIAFDQASHQTVMFGGDTRRGVVDDTWAWDGLDWKRLNPASSPSARSGVRMAYDGPRNELVLFGGSDYGGVLGDTWTWDGVTWTER